MTAWYAAQVLASITRLCLDCANSSVTSHFLSVPSNSERQANRNVWSAALSQARSRCLGSVRWA